MSESLDKASATQIANIEKSTGKKLAEWIAIVNKSGFAKHGELVNFLKEKHGFTHGNANMVVHQAKQSHAGAAENDIDWIAEQYKGKEEMKPWYDKIMNEISKFGKDIEVSPKKAYVSLRRKKTVCHHPTIYQNQDGYRFKYKRCCSLWKRGSRRKLECHVYTPDQTRK